MRDSEEARRLASSPFPFSHYWDSVTAMGIKIMRPFPLDPRWFTLAEGSPPLVIIYLRHVQFLLAIHFSDAARLIIVRGDRIIALLSILFSGMRRDNAVDQIRLCTVSWPFLEFRIWIWLPEHRLFPSHATFKENSGKLNA